MIIVLFTVGVVLTNAVIQRRYDSALVTQQAMIACNKAANSLQTESDMLTLCINNYVDTGNTESIFEYYRIIDTKQREGEIEKAEKYNVDCTALRNALEYSDELAEIERHAFALVSAANGIGNDAPTQVKNYPLSAEELSLSPDEKIAEAQNIVHSKNYNDYKRNISQQINIFENNVLFKTEYDLIDETEDIANSMNRINLFAVLGNVLVIVMAAVLYKNVTSVLKKYIRSIESNEHIASSGTSEMVYLADVFNNYIDLRNAEQQDLRSKAELDSLTGIANRRALNAFIKERLADRNSKGAFLYIDIDNFKSINDTHGHDAGDKLLIAFAKSLRDNLADADFAARLGGDEFAVWIDGVDKNDSAPISSFFDSVRKCRTDLPDNIAVTVNASAGVCFYSGDDTAESLIGKADAALYEVKRSQKSGMKIYD